MRKPGICLDLDNVLAITDEVMRDIIRQLTGGDVDLRYEDVVTFNYWECKDSRGRCISRAQWDEVHRVFSRPEYILSIRPYDNVQWCLSRIAEKLDLHIVTTRLRSARQATVEWLDRHAFPDHSLHFVRQREKHIVLGAFAASVDDDLVQAEAFASVGTSSYVLAHPWNQSASESPTVRVPDWPTLCERLLESDRTNIGAQLVT